MGRGRFDFGELSLPGLSMKTPVLGLNRWKAPVLTLIEKNVFDIQFALREKRLENQMHICYRYLG